jgi:hypothetical protein
MPCYLVIDGMKQEMEEDIFDQMVETLHQPDIPDPPLQTSTRWKPDGTYDKKPNDPQYFQKYYQKKLSTPFTCPDCGRTISSKSNLSKHRQTNICMKKRCQCWNRKPFQQQFFLLNMFLCWTPTTIPKIPTGNQNPKTT